MVHINSFNQSFCTLCVCKIVVSPFLVWLFLIPQHKMILNYIDLNRKQTRPQCCMLECIRNVVTVSCGAILKAMQNCAQFSIYIICIANTILWSILKGEIKVFVGQQKCIKLPNCPQNCRKLDRIG